MTQTPTAAIIGAGISGLTAGKNLAGITYDCFEASDRIGGNWAQESNGHRRTSRRLSCSRRPTSRAT
jgi:cation diffusion facilitator CzcD-associated flavoprotein CzcO